LLVSSIGSRPCSIASFMLPARGFHSPPRSRPRLVRSLSYS
jgi:hypothetical protein